MPDAPSWWTPLWACTLPAATVLRVLWRHATLRGHAGQEGLHQLSASSSPQPLCAFKLCSSPSSFTPPPPQCFVPFPPPAGSPWTRHPGRWGGRRGGWSHTPLSVPPWQCLRRLRHAERQRVRAATAPPHPNERVLVPAEENLAFGTCVKPQHLFPSRLFPPLFAPATQAVPCHPACLAGRVVAAGAAEAGRCKPGRRAVTPPPWLPCGLRLWAAGVDSATRPRQPWRGAAMRKAAGAAAAKRGAIPPPLPCCCPILRTLPPCALQGHAARCSPPCGYFAGRENTKRMASFFFFNSAAGFPPWPPLRLFLLLSSSPSSFFFFFFLLGCGLQRKPHSEE